MAERDDLEEAGLLDLDFAQVLKEEQSAIAEKQRGGSRGKRFSLAFSGGGTRAAAFQAGVLWQLAKLGKIKDMEYLGAVSGGAYIASSFATHVHAAPPPAADESIDAWYLGIVAKAICRMQRNAGNFVRDPAQAGRLAWLDLPIFIFMFLATILINPIEVLIVYLVPITEGIHLFFAAGLRASVCSSTGQTGVSMLGLLSPFPAVESTFYSVLFLTFTAWVLSQLPMTQPAKDSPNGHAFLLVQGALAFLSRFTVVLMGLLLLLTCIPMAQEFSFQSKTLNGRSPGLSQRKYCDVYVRQMYSRAHNASFACSNQYHGSPWYTHPQIWSAADAYDMAPVQQETLDKELVDTFATNSLTSVFAGVLLSALVVSGLLVPLVPELFLTVLTFTGPAILFVLIVLFVQFRIYGPVTGQTMLWKYIHYNAEGWDTFVTISFLCSLVLVPFYHDFRSLFHSYYVRTLRNFFESGQDICFEDLSRDRYCPLLIYTGTVSDYVKPGTEQSTTEISMSPLHTGSETTGYVRTPEYRTLGKCTALTSAAGIDAAVLSMVDHLKFRFWLQALNLSWGDYILFLRREHRCFQGISRWFGQRFGPFGERMSTAFWHSLPTNVCWFVYIAAWYTGWFGAADIHTSTGCSTAKTWVFAAIVFMLVIVGLSFFTFIPWLDWLTFSPIVRQLHQATRFMHRGYKPPGMLYVTDGGVQDCTAIVQLVQRRCERILLVLANADPSDELEVLRGALDVVAKEQLGSFFDPQDSKRDVRILLDEFRDNQDMPYMNLGIRYGWNSKADEVQMGELFVVKNRLPPSLKDLRVRPLLTEEEIAEGRTLAGDYPMKASELGGLGCSDCCHRNGCNCGAKFPHLTGANYLWLTPTLFSSLCRLGHDVSVEAIAKILG